MKDRTVFEKIVLENGITVYSKPMDVPFAYAWLVLPVGHVHNTGDILPGTAHFLEHVQCSRSRLYPEYDTYNSFVALNGGEFNAATSAAWTEYKLEIPTDFFASAFDGLVSHALESVFDERDIQREAGIISSERRKESQWWPGDNELEFHCMTKWKHVRSLSLRQIFGEDPDLKQMNAERLARMHKAYLDPRAYVLVGGSFDCDLVCKKLSRFKTAKHELPVQTEPLRWEHREYHEEKFPDTNRFLYHLGGIVEERSPQVVEGIHFISDLLTNTIHGALYNWLRRDLGWSYGLGFEMTVGHPNRHTDWEMWLPVNSYEQAKQVRKEIQGRILTAIQDKKLLETEVMRKLSARVFWYQTVEQILKEASNLLVTFQRLVNETEGVALIEKCKDVAFLQNIYEKYWSPEVSGEFLAIPEKT